jgi:hypothetical protein
MQACDEGAILRSSATEQRSLLTAGRTRKAYEEQIQSACAVLASVNTCAFGRVLLHWPQLQRHLVTAAYNLSAACGVRLTVTRFVCTQQALQLPLVTTTAACLQMVGAA